MRFVLGVLLGATAVMTCLPLAAGALLTWLPAQLSEQMRNETFKRERDTLILTCAGTVFAGLVVLTVGPHKDRLTLLAVSAGLLGGLLLADQLVKNDPAGTRLVGFGFLIAGAAFLLALWLSGGSSEFGWRTVMGLVGASVLLFVASHVLPVLAAATADWRQRVSDKWRWDLRPRVVLGLICLAVAGLAQARAIIV